MDAVMSNAFPAMCDGVSFLCWIVDERGHVLHAGQPDDTLQFGHAAAGCGGAGDGGVNGNGVRQVLQVAAGHDEGRGAAGAGGRGGKQ